MGYIKHHSIIVTSHFREDIKKAHEMAIYLFSEVNNDTYKFSQSIVTNIVEGLANSQYTFFISPDGSKEGWGLSDQCDEKRAEFIKWLNENHTSCHYVEVAFGGDDEYCEILNHN
ncbi:hypothetical protein [Chryseobacterium sp.]|uniref:hypothetical protein n=1 Tax=Chryseobacterium sp. TaxID=1871047 RepID=UPI002899D125|nr:hypothetical protein [Chryseobacterium sp.]